MRTAPPPKDPAVLARDFPTVTWPAQQPLSRVHRVEHDTAYFATGQDGRFNPPTPSAGFGTLYLSSHRRGAWATKKTPIRWPSSGRCVCGRLPPVIIEQLGQGDVLPTPLGAEPKGNWFE